MHRKKGLHRQLLGLVILALLLIAGLTVWLQSKSIKKTATLQSGSLIRPAMTIGAFQLTDDHGKSFTNKNLQGHWSLLFFGFTHCQAICPTTLARLNQAYQQLQQHNHKLPKVVFISVDPKRDSKQQIRTYLNHFNPAFIGVTGNIKQLRKLSKRFGILYVKTKQTNSASYEIDHSNVIVVVNPQGKWAGILTSPVNGKTIAKDLLHIQKLT